MSDLAAYPRFRLADFAPGDVRESTLRIAAGAINAFVALTGDEHPLHSNPDFAAGRGHIARVCHGLLVASYVSPYIARHFLGSSGLLVSFASRFQNPAYEGMTLKITGRVESVSSSTGLMNVAWRIEDGEGRLIQSGTAGCLMDRSP